MASPNQQPYCIIAVMGATGSGKTTFINLASGSDMRIGTGLESCTTEVLTTAPFEFEGRSVVMIDTPGFDDTNKSDTDILKMIAAFLATSYELGAKLAGVIYMHRISDNRMGGISTRNFRMFRELCGSSSLKNVAIVTNMWGTVPQDIAEARERQLASTDNFFKPVLSKGASFLRHENTLKSVQAILQRIVTNRPMVLRIQRELVDEKKDISETAAGAELNRELMEQAQKHQVELRKLHADMQDAIKRRDEETRQELQADFDKMNAEMKRIQSDSANMASSYKEEKANLERRILEMNQEANRQLESANQAQQRQTEEFMQKFNSLTEASAAERLEMMNRIGDLQRRLEESDDGWCIVS